MNGLRLDWDRRPCRLLANMEDNVEDDLARRTVSFLQEYRRLADAYAEASLDRRRALLERVTALVDGYFANVEETAGWLPGTETLFEDAAGDASLVLDLGDLGDLLAEYVRLTRPFIWLLGEQANMRHFFTEHYGSDPVPLLRFYEDYYREHLDDHLERETFAQLSNPFRLELVEKLNEARRGLAKLYLLPEEVTQDLVAANRRLTRSELAEICGDASYNGDLHPPMLPEEIAYPTAEGGSAREQISVSDLLVEPDPRRPFRVRLVNATTGREVIPVDLGFRNPQMRPLLFQMLSRMTPAAAFVLNPSAHPEEPEDVDPAAPARVGESESGHFLRIQRWREELGLPEEVFVRIEDLGRLPGKRPGLRDHFAKPQYIDFRNPLLIDLFSRMTENLETFQVILEERLPGRDHLIPAGEERFVTEMILQLDFPEREATPLPQEE